MKFTEELREKVAPIWDACHEYPFVRGGTQIMPGEQSQSCLKQDS
ncbi:MAG: hypothetical protein ACOX1X_06405 [Dethiobacteria bacterium]